MSLIQSLDRGMRILDLLAAADDGLSVTQLAAALAIDKGSASRLVQTLAAHDLAQKDPVTRRYRLGARLAGLGERYLHQSPLPEAARPHLRRLAGQTGECAHLGIHWHAQVLYVAQVESPAALRVNADVGFTAPLHCTALGKVLLAFGAAPLPAECPACTPNTLTTPAALQADLEATRARGYALDDEEFDAGVRCIAAPVYDSTRRAVAALGISGPAARMAPDALPSLAAAVIEAARALSLSLGANMEPVNNP